MPHIRDAAIDFYKDRLRQKETKAALRKFREENGRCKYEDSEIPPCYMGETPKWLNRRRRALWTHQKFTRTQKGMTAPSGR